MEKTIGKLYCSKDKEVVILCTDLTESPNRFGGVVLKARDFSDMYIGYRSMTFTWHPDIFEEFVGEITLNNKNWKEYKEIGTCQG